MVLSKLVKNLIIIFIIFSFIFVVYLKFFKKVEKVTQTEVSNDVLYSSNIINDVRYTTKDANGNEYIITALKGEIDYSNPNDLYLTKVDALIKLKNSNDIIISSNFGKYNIDNLDTIFSKNVIITYTDNKIKAEYLDFSLKRNLMLISKNVVYNNFNNILKADVVEIDIKSKDVKIFMYEKNKKVNVNNKNLNGNY
tara:strand:+ start:1527 stop:2114 length:588 start_codon:yes stop_codon:yes gene_type:complete